MALQAKLLAGPTASVKAPGTGIAQPLAPSNMSGRWRDNWGNVYQITQQDNELTFSAVGLSCKNTVFQSSGRGRVAGNSVQSSYKLSIGSIGECKGTILNLGSL